MTCNIQRQQDEFYCSECNKRWDVNDDPVPCGKSIDVPVSGGVSRRGVPVHRDTYTEWHPSTDYRWGQWYTRISVDSAPRGAVPRFGAKRSAVSDHSHDSTGANPIQCPVVLHH